MWQETVMTYIKVTTILTFDWWDSRGLVFHLRSEPQVLIITPLNICGILQGKHSSICLEVLKKKKM